MKLLCTLLLLPPLLGFHSRDIAAQAPYGNAPVPFIGFAAAISSLPTEFQGCGGAGHATAELRGGIAWGSLALEGRGALLQSLGTDLCLNMGRVELFEDRYTTAVYPFSHSDTHTALDARVRYTTRTRIPLGIAAGAGWFAPQDVPYILTSAGVRTPGRVRLALDVDQSWFRLSYDLVTRVYGERGPGAELSRGPAHEWRTGLAVRIGAEIPLR